MLQSAVLTLRVGLDRGGANPSRTCFATGGCSPAARQPCLTIRIFFSLTVCLILASTDHALSSHRGERAPHRLSLLRPARPLSSGDQSATYADPGPTSRAPMQERDPENRPTVHSKRYLYVSCHSSSSVRPVRHTLFDCRLAIWLLAFCFEFFLSLLCNRYR